MWKDNGSIQIHISDVRSLYPGCGISDAIIDLYIRYIHNSITYMYMYTHHPYIHNNITYVRYTKAYGCIYIYRCWIPSSVHSQCVGALSYTAIAEVLEGHWTAAERKQALLRRFKATCTVKLPQLLTKEILVFPCKVQ